MPRGAGREPEKVYIKKRLGTVTGRKVQGFWSCMGGLTNTGYCRRVWRQEPRETVVSPWSCSGKKIRICREERYAWRW